MLKPEFPIKDRKGRNEKKGKEGFPIKDRKKVKRNRSEENRIIPHDNSFELQNK